MFFFFNDTATTEIYTLSLHDALPISTRACLTKHLTVIIGGSGRPRRGERTSSCPAARRPFRVRQTRPRDRKSTRLNSSHANISYAVFCLKKKNFPRY